PHLPGAPAAAAPGPSAASPPDSSLPPDLDRATPGTLRARLPRLGLDEVIALRAQEQAAGRRAPILAMLDGRIAKLQAAAR
ncbi:MAG: hypothetical protein M3P96_05430, partial [Actinomycetota bacterium]|nr:hypothetical protein [Actinomycetota bacterium]